VPAYFLPLSAATLNIYQYKASFVSLWFVKVFVSPLSVLLATTNERSVVSIIMVWGRGLLLVTLLAAYRAVQAQQLAQQGAQGLTGLTRHLQSSCDTTPFSELKPVRDPLAFLPQSICSSSLTGCHAILQTFLESKVAGVEWAGVDDQVGEIALLQQQSLHTVFCFVAVAEYYITQHADQ
jgi:hypothetical protein